MTRDRDRWLVGMKAIERECVVLEIALTRLTNQAREDPTILTQRRLTPKDLKVISNNLDGTYIIRLFAEFEIGLRLY